MRSTKHIDDLELKKLYDDVWDEPWQVLTERGPALRDSCDDRLAVLECMAEACRVIIEDLEEHGEVNACLCDDNGYGFFVPEAERLDKIIAEERARGATSDVFSRWRNGQEDDDDDELIDDIVDDVMGTKCKALVQALAASYEDDAEGFAAVLQKIGELSSKTDYADHVSGYVQNGLIAHYQSSDLEGACLIVRGYATLVGKGYAHGEHHFEAVATAVSIAQLSGDDETAMAVFSKLVPQEIQHARLAFNLACLASIREEKGKCLEFTALALKLGKSADQFDDSDFDNIRGNADFQALLA